MSNITNNKNDQSDGDLMQINPLPLNNNNDKEHTNLAIPNLLSSVENEWNNLLAEKQKLTQVLDATRKQLSHALYENEACHRIVANLLQENERLKNMINNNNTEDSQILEKQHDLSEIELNDSKNAKEAHNISEDKVNGNKDAKESHDTFEIKQNHTENVIKSQNMLETKQNDNDIVKKSQNLSETVVKDQLNNDSTKMKTDDIEENKKINNETLDKDQNSNIDNKNIDKKIEENIEIDVVEKNIDLTSERLSSNRRKKNKLLSKNLPSIEALNNEYFNINGFDSNNLSKLKKMVNVKELPNGNFHLLGYNDNLEVIKMELYNLEKGDYTTSDATFNTFSSPITALKFHPTNENPFSYIASNSNGIFYHNVQLTNVYKANIQYFDYHPSNLYFMNLQIDQDGNNSLYFDSLHNFKHIYNIKLPFKINASIPFKFHPDGNLLGIMNPQDNKTLLYDVKTKEPLVKLALDNPIAIEFSENGYFFAIASLNHINIWDLRKNQIFRTIKLDNNENINGIDIDQSGKLLSVCTDKYGILMTNIKKEYNSNFNVNIKAIANPYKIQFSNNYNEMFIHTNNGLMIGSKKKMNYL